MHEPLLDVSLLNIQQYERKVYSQNGEDGILEELIRRIQPHPYFTEFGVEDGVECCTRYLAEKNWSGIQIEAREDCWHDLRELNRRHRRRVHSLRSMVTLDNLGELFACVPQKYGLAVVDVDGNDVYFAQEIARKWQPSIICVEVNHHRDADKPWQQPYREDWSWDGIRKDYGTSLFSMNLVMTQFKYIPLGTDSTGVNAFYVRDDEIIKLAWDGHD